MKLDHIGIAVHSIEKALRSYQVAMGLEMEGAIDVEEQKVRVAMLPVGESRIELLEATDPSSPICRFLAKKGEGVHHICFKVVDLDREAGGFQQGRDPDSSRCGRNRLRRPADRLSPSAFDPRGID